MTNGIKGKLFLSGKKDPSTDLWTLPIYADSGQETEVVPAHPQKLYGVPTLKKWNSTVSQKLKPTELSTAEPIKKNKVDQTTLI